MKFKQGKFFNDAGEVVPLEFGNKQQIHILETVRQLKEDGSVYWRNVFICFCGAVHEKQFVDGKKWRCECGAKYQFSFYESEYDFIPIIKMVSK